MTNKHEVIALIKRGMTPQQIAVQLNCCDAYVRATAQRNGLSTMRGVYKKRTPTAEWVVRTLAQADDERRAALRIALGC